MATWNPAKNDLDSVLALPEGRLIANFGFHCEVSFYASDVMQIASELKAKLIDADVYSQAGVMILGQKHDLECMSEYAPLSGG